MFKSSEREVIQYRDVGNNVKELYEKKRVELEEFQKKVSNNENIAEFDVNKVFEELRQYENEIRKYLRKINVILESLLSNFNASARLELDSRLDENNYEYFSGIRIYATFADRNEIEIEDEDIDLSGGQKTKLIICILLALIKSNSIKKEIPFLLLDEFDAQLDEKSHIDVLNLLKNEVGAKQIIILSPNRIAPKALFAEQFFLFTNSESEEPKIKLIAIKNKNVMS
jgi:chromosome segregation ATPase